jgi:hypothetical protein
MDKLASLVSDEMADTFGIYGTVDEVKEKMKRFDGIVDEVILGGPWYRVEMVRLIENYQLMLQAFAPSAGGAV